MKIHFFEVEIISSSDEMLSDVLDRICGRAIGNREREVNNKRVFLETCNRNEDASLYEMDFTARRTTNGPGHSRRGRQTEDFDLQDDGGFGEQTAALWSSLGYMAVQYNHHGIRPAAIGYYLQRFLSRGATQTPPQLKLKPVVDENVFARLLNSRMRKRFTVSVNAETITDAMAGDNVALRTIWQLRRYMQAGRIELTLSYGSDRRGGPLQNVRETIRRLLNNRETLRSMKVTVESGLDDSIMVLDMLKQREFVEVPDRQLVQTAGLRYSYDSRIDAIRREFGRWLERRQN